MSSEESLRREVAAARLELAQVRRIAAEAMRGMSDQDILDLRDRLERGEGNGCTAGDADQRG